MEMRPTVLVVDDSEANRYAVCRMLRQCGLAVVEAGTGQEALARIDADRPDLVVLDVQLPDVSGIEVCRRIKADPALGATPVLHVSAVAVTPSSQVQGLEAGADGYLIHPFDSTVLLATVNSLLRMHRAERQQRAFAQQWQASFDAIRDAVCLLDGDGSIVRANRALEHLAGHPLSTVVGRPLDEVLMPTLCCAAAFPPAGAAAGGRQLKEVESDGRWFRLTADPVTDEAGVLAGAVYIIADITTDKRAEAEIAALNQRLRRSIVEAQHRIKNNLQVLSALVEMQLMNHGETVSAEELRRIGQHIRALASLHDLLTTTSRESGEVEHVSSRLTVDKLIDVLQGVSGGRPIRSQVEDVRLSVRQASALTLLVNECIQNSVKHGATEVMLRLGMADDLVRLEIGDDGPGFPSDFHPRTYAHTGLDLIETLSRWDLQGQVRYSNRPDGGALVTVDFPRAA